MTTHDNDPRLDHLRDWLRDAHAMEEQAETMLKGMAGRLEHYPTLKARIEQHVGETQRQATALRQCIDSLGASTSALKDAGGKMMASAQGMSGMFASDEVVKGALFSYSFEHLEIASYRSLIAAAKATGQAEIAQVCTTILEEEIAMAKWLEEHLPTLTIEFLERDSTGAPAKR